MAAKKGFRRNATAPKIAVRPSRYGLGVFACESIPWGIPIVEYTGQIISKAEGKRRSDFYDSIGYTALFELDSKRDIDGLIGGNEARFINHSMTPNCQQVRINGRILICAMDDISEGAELFIDYGFQPSKRKE